MPIRALLDACVLVPMQSCDLLLSVAKKRLYKPLWSQDILTETARATIRPGIGLDRAAIDKRIKSMLERFPYSTVSDYELLIPHIDLPDSDDRHVMAAALAGNADYLVTHNTKDFPGLPPSLGLSSITGNRSITVVTPDSFLMYLYEQNRGGVQAALTEMSARRKNPPTTSEQLLGQLNSGYFPGLVAAIMRDGAEESAQQTLRQLENLPPKPAKAPVSPARGSAPIRPPHIPMKQLDQLSQPNKNPKF